MRKTVIVFLIEWILSKLVNFLPLSTKQLSALQHKYIFCVALTIKSNAIYTYLREMLALTITLTTALFYSISSVIMRFIVQVQFRNNFIIQCYVFDSHLALNLHNRRTSTAPLLERKSERNIHCRFQNKSRTTHSLFYL